MTEELITLSMTTTEYKEYRNCQKALKQAQQELSQLDERAITARDMYVSEFEERQKWSKRAIKAEKKLDKLLDIVHSTMPDKLRLENLSFEIEEACKERDYKHD